MIRMTAVPALLLAVGLLSAPAWADEPKPYPVEAVASFPVPEARQAVAVDADSFYAIDSRAIARCTVAGPARCRRRHCVPWPSAGRGCS